MSKFTPFTIQSVPGAQTSPHSRLTVTATLKGSAADDFQKMLEETGLNRSQLLVQMVYHCLGKTGELKDFYRRIAVLGE